MKRIFFWLALTTGWFLHAQTVEFGKVSRTDFDTSGVGDHPAVMLHKKYELKIEPDEKEGLIARIQVHERIRIQNREGFDHAEKHILLYHTRDQREKVTGLKGFTYRLENGKIQKIKLDKKDIYREQTDDNLETVKFSMPGVREGSIVEWSYKLVTPFLNLLDEIELQEYIPLQNLEVDLYIPEYVHYQFYTKGYLPVHFSTAKKTKSATLFISPMDLIRRLNYSDADAAYVKIGGLMQEYQPRMSSPQPVTLDYEETRYSLRKKNVPAMRREPYSGNPDNFKSGVVPELKFFKYDQRIIPVTLSWDQMAEKFYESETGKSLKKQKYLQDSLRAVLARQPRDTLVAILEWVKNNIRWNGKRRGKIDVKHAFKKGSGNAFEVNLNLVNMLRAAGYEAYPVFISTESHGIMLFPGWRMINHVLAGVKKGDRYVLLDATDRFGAPDVLPDEDLNFYGQVFKDEGKAEMVELFPSKPALYHTQWKLQWEGEGMLKGLGTAVLTRHFARAERESLADATDREKFIRQKYSELDIERSRINAADKYHLPLREMFQFKTDVYIRQAGDRLFVNPFLSEAVSESPFTSPERMIPVIFHYPFIVTKQSEIPVPPGYEIEHLPPETNFESKEAGLSYKMTVERQGDKVVMKTYFENRLPVIPANRYPALRDFWHKMVQAETDQIVFKRK
ncbi:MAG: DUF3857 and transglutaminase domain-containing protein [Chlorobi bacterium]|nr:DUF3857 and transglutaminase domain-containing protein [Chlorobiota bacterium]